MQEITIRITKDSTLVETNNRFATSVGHYAPSSYSEAEAKSIGSASNNDEAVTLMAGAMAGPNDNIIRQGLNEHDYIKVQHEELEASRRIFAEQLARAQEIIGKRGLNTNALEYIFTGEKPSRRAKQPRKKASRRK